MQLRKQTGWSLVELTIILIVLSILCAILMPVIGRYVRNAKVCRAREDVQALGMSIWMYIEDTANSYFLQDGSPNVQKGAGRQSGSPAGSAPDQRAENRVELLVSDGDIPELGPDGDSEWKRAVNFGKVDFFEYHLVTNNPGAAIGNAYRTPLDLDKGGPDGDSPNDPMFARRESGGFNSEFAWRGPYITAPIDPDPWGNRYASNVKFLDPQADTGNDTPASNGFTEDVIVLTAGPDEEVDTMWAVDGLTPGDDDIIYTLSANSRP